MIYGTIFVLCILVIFFEVDYTGILVFFDSYTVIITVIVGWSLNQLNKYQRQIRGVFANEYLMVIHFSCLLYICLLFLCQDIWLIVNTVNDIPTIDCRQIVYDISHLIFLIIEGFLWLVVDTLFLIFFIKYSRKLTNDETESL